MKLKIRALGMGFVFLLLSTSAVFAAENRAKPLAYVYMGQGSCVEGCSEAAADMAYKAGFHPVYIYPQDITEYSTPDYVKHFFDGVKVWIQPGGYSRQAYEAMNPKLRETLLNYIFSGGGYTGFCAGAFITTNQIGTTGTPGFSIFPGKTAPLMPPPARPDLQFSIEEVQWAGKKRAIYFEGGPYMYDLPPQVEVIATYTNGKVAAARTSFGLGRVYIAGPHPEAPSWWSSPDGVTDRDGMDHDLAVSMLKWAAGSKRQ